ncbi:hypothetical protein Tco_1422153, partial [Tanacetum coccineum]
MESEFVALAAAGKEAKWLRNLILKFSIWSNPIISISIRCDSAATLAKAYSQMELRLSLKVDIQKAYDMVDWVFLGNILKCFGFHPTMIKWTMVCVLSTSFSICINGDVHGFLKDDLFMFARGDVESARVIMESLDEFKLTSGLVPSIPILNIMPFSEGELPIKYLGVPLISSRLLNKDCKVLAEKAKSRIGDWKNKSLSFVGRLQLCKSVISSMHIYWASVLAIPKGIILDIQNLKHGFLWCNGDYKRGKAKVAWVDICLPLSEGGLGLRSLEGQALWDIPIKADVSWGWRKLLQLRDRVRPYMWFLGMVRLPQSGLIIGVTIFRC